MKILLVSATESEIEPALAHLNNLGNPANINGNSIETLITGVGMTATAFAMGQALSNSQFDLAVNLGIAGAFDRSLKIAEVVSVTLDCFAELGAEDGDDFLTIDELGFGKSSIKPDLPFEHFSVLPFKRVRSITVNKVHGNDESIYEIATRLNPHTETMEGAAFFYACNQARVPCLQLRAISNYIEQRNRANWNIPLATKNLNNILIEFLTNLQ